MEEKPGTVDISDQSHHSENITGIIHPLVDLSRLPQSIRNSVGSGRRRVTNSGGSWTSGPSMMRVSCTLILIPEGFFPIRWEMRKARHNFLKVTSFFLLHSDCPYSCVFYYPIIVLKHNISSSQHQCRR